MTLTIYHLLAAATPQPVPTPTDLEATDISPGVLGFIATFAVVLVTVLLMLDMSRRMRRLRNRQRAEQERLAEQAEAERGNP